MLGLDLPSSLNANESSWVGYRDLPPQSRSLLVCLGILRFRSCNLLVGECCSPRTNFSHRCGLCLVAGLGAQQF